MRNIFLIFICGLIGFSAVAPTSAQAETSWDLFLPAISAAGEIDECKKIKDPIARLECYKTPPPGRPIGGPLTTIPVGYPEVLLERENRRLEALFERLQHPDMEMAKMEEKRESRQY